MICDNVCTDPGQTVSPLPPSMMRVFAPLRYVEAALSIAAHHIALLLCFIFLSPSQTGCTSASTSLRAVGHGGWRAALEYVWLGFLEEFDQP